MGKNPLIVDMPAELRVVGEEAALGAIAQSVTKRGKFAKVIADERQQGIVFRAHQSILCGQSRITEAVGISSVERTLPETRKIDDRALNSEIETEQQARGTPLQVQTGVQQFGGSRAHP